MIHHQRREFASSLFVVGPLTAPRNHSFSVRHSAAHGTKPASPKMGELDPTESIDELEVVQRLSQV